MSASACVRVCACMRVCACVESMKQPLSPDLLGTVV